MRARPLSLKSCTHLDLNPLLILRLETGCTTQPMQQLNQTWNIMEQTTKWICNICTHPQNCHKSLTSNQNCLCIVKTNQCKHKSFFDTSHLVVCNAKLANHLIAIQKNSNKGSPAICCGLLASDLPPSAYEMMQVHVDSSTPFAQLAFRKN